MFNVIYLDHISDIKIRVEADTFNELLDGCVDAFANFVCGKKQGYEIRVLDKDYSQLLNNYNYFFQKNKDEIEQFIFTLMSELVFLFDSERFVATIVEIKDSGLILKGSRCFELKNEVKAMTYHELNIEKKRNKYIAEFILDL